MYKYIFLYDYQPATCTIFISYLLDRKCVLLISNRIMNCLDQVKETFTYLFSKLLYFLALNIDSLKCECEQHELINVLIVFDTLSVSVKEERLYMASGI